MKTTFKTALFSLIAIVGLSVLLSSCECDCEDKCEGKLTKEEWLNFLSDELASDNAFMPSSFSNDVRAELNELPNVAFFEIDADVVPLVTVSDTEARNQVCAAHGSPGGVRHGLVGADRTSPLEYWPVDRSSIVQALKAYAINRHEGLVFYPSYKVAEGYHSIVFGPYDGNDRLVNGEFHNLVEPCPSQCFNNGEAPLTRNCP